MRASTIPELLVLHSTKSMFRRILASAFVWLLAWLPLVQARAQQLPNDTARAASPHQAKVQQYPVGTSVEVRLRNKEKISGRLEKYAGDGFWIRAEGHGARKSQKIFFFELQSVKPARSNARQSGAKREQPRFSMDLSIGGTAATVRVYGPQESEDSEESNPPR
ncbi:MAG TPA: hypothetical protein VI455_19125 [Terriglobia bacterium]